MTAGLVLTWNSITSSAAAPGLYVQQVRRRMTGGVRDVRVALPGRDGGYLFTENRGTRTILADCLLVADTIEERRATIVDVADWVDVPGEARLVVSDQPDRYWLAALRVDPDPDEWRRLSRFTIEWEAQPYAYAVSTSSETLTASGAPSDTGTFAVVGDLEAYPEVTVVPIGGNLTSLDWTLNGDTLTWSGSAITPAGALVLSSISDTITTGASIDAELTGAYDPNAVVMQDADGAFGTLVPGTNSWEADWTGTATGLTITVRWRRRYR